MKEKPKKYEMHADGVKEVDDDCPFCAPEPNCDEPFCPYTKDENESKD